MADLENSAEDEKTIIVLRALVDQYWEDQGERPRVKLQTRAARRGFEKILEDLNAGRIQLTVEDSDPSALQG